MIFSFNYQRRIYQWWVQWLMVSWSSSVAIIVQQQNNDSSTSDHELSYSLIDPSSIVIDQLQHKLCCGEGLPDVVCHAVEGVSGGIVGGESTPGNRRALVKFSGVQRATGFLSPPIDTGFSTLVTRLVPLLDRLRYEEVLRWNHISSSWLIIEVNHNNKLGLQVWYKFS